MSKVDVVLCSVPFHSICAVSFDFVSFDLCRFARFRFRVVSFPSVPLDSFFFFLFRGLSSKSVAGTPRRCRHPSQSKTPKTQTRTDQDQDPDQPGFLLPPAVTRTATSTPTAALTTARRDVEGERTDRDQGQDQNPEEERGGGGEGSRRHRITEESRRTAAPPTAAAAAKAVTVQGVAPLGALAPAALESLVESVDGQRVTMMNMKREGWGAGTGIGIGIGVSLSVAVPAAAAVAASAAMTEAAAASGATLTALWTSSSCRLLGVLLSFSLSWFVGVVVDDDDDDDGAAKLGFDHAPTYIHTSRSALFSLRG